MVSAYRVILSFLLVSLPAIGQEKMTAEMMPAPAGAQNVTPPVLQPRDPRYLLRVGDVLEISFRFVPEFNRTVTVQPDGFINLRDLPDLQVAGKTTPELTKLLEKSYAKILHDPVITVELKDFEKPYFIAMGEVGRPGKYDLRGEATVVQAIGMAGGFNEKSKHSQVLLFRRISDQWTEVKMLDMKAMLASANLTEDLQIHPGDLVYVPKNAISKIMPFIPTATIGIYVPRY